MTKFVRSPIRVHRFEPSYLGASIWAVTYCAGGYPGWRPIFVWQSGRNLRQAHQRAVRAYADDVKLLRKRMRT